MHKYTYDCCHCTLPARLALICYSQLFKQFCCYMWSFGNCHDTEHFKEF